MGAAAVTGVAMSALIHGYLKLRDLQQALIAGMVVGGSASYFITNPAYSLACGVTAGLLQPIFELCIERPIYRKVGLLCTYSPSVFALQSFVSCVYMALLSVKSRSNPNQGFTFTS